MFQRKILQQISKKEQELEAEKAELLSIKQELIFISEQLENSTPKIDISNVYVWKANGLYNIVRLYIEKIYGRTWGGIGRETSGYKSVLIDIFTNKVIYEKNSISKIKSKELIDANNIENSYYAYLFSIYDVDKNLLAYTDKKVPLYVLQQLYYRLNNVDVKNYVLKKEE